MNGPQWTACLAKGTTVAKALFYSMDLSAIQWLSVTKLCLRTSASMEIYKNKLWAKINRN